MNPNHNSGRLQGGWVAIATLLRPQGRRGELLAEPLSDLPEIFTAGRAVTLATAGAMPQDGHPLLTIEEHWFPTGKNAGRVVLKLSGCASISEAEALAGQQVMMEATALPTLEEDTFFVGDLLGCALLDADQTVGTVMDLEFPTGPDGRTRLEDAAPLLAVRLTGNSEDSDLVLVPFVRAWLDSVNIAARRIVMHLPPGLLSGAEESDDDESSASSDVD